VLDDKEMRTVLTITEKLPLGFRNLSTNKISGIGAAPVNLFPLIIKQFASEIKGYGIVEVFLNNGEICFTSHYDLPTSLTDSIKDYLITTYPNISGYRWKPNATQRREYAERMREKEAMPIIPVSYAIRVGCFVKFYNVGKGEVVSGTVIKESYGEKTGQHTFTIQSEDGTKTLVKGRNLYPNLLEHIPGDISKQVSR
jgi:hypothetical protein